MVETRLDIGTDTATLATDDTRQWLESDCIVDLTDWQ